MNLLIIREISAVLILSILATLIALMEYEVYTKAKKRGYKLTCSQAIRLQIKAFMIAFKVSIVWFARFALLVIIMTLPPVGVGLLTELSISFTALAIGSLLGVVQSHLPLDIEIAVSSLSALVGTAVIYYFLNRYGAIYKFPILILFNDSFKQYLMNRLNINDDTLKEILGALSFGSLMYAVQIAIVWTDLVSSPSILSGIIVSVTLAILLGYVVFNRKYENVINLIEKIWRIEKEEGGTRMIRMKTKGKKVYIYAEDKINETEWLVKVKKEHFELCVAKKRELGVKDPVKDAMIDYALLHQCVTPKASSSEEKRS